MPSWLLPLLLVASSAYLWVRLKGTEAKLQAQERTDALTEAPNRKAFLEACEEEMARARRTGRPLTVARLDLDDFGALNARRGQAAGDACLRATADAIRAQLRSTDRFARTGDDEFSLLLPETGLAEAREPLDKIRKALSALEGAPGLSIGARSYIQTPQTLDEMLRDTGNQVALAKSSGKSRTEHG